MRCECQDFDHAPRLVVLTGGPGAGKTAVLEIVKRNFCEHVQVLPEAASLVFGGGFPREASLPWRAAAQRAIYHVQRELERASVEQRKAAVVLCDRGTLDGLAYWPFEEARYFDELGIERSAELGRYGAVVHLRTPDGRRGYGHTNPLRIETALEAHEIDLGIEAAWAGHPARAFVDSDEDFLHKVARAVSFIREQVPACCRKHRIPEVD